SQYGACIRAVTGTGLAQRLGMGDIGPRLEAMWLAAAEEALEADEVSLAMLPLGQVIAPDGYLARLRERGYEVEAPWARLRKRPGRDRRAWPGRGRRRPRRSSLRRWPAMPVPAPCRCLR